MIHITLQDGTLHTFSPSITPREIVEITQPKHIKKILATSFNGHLIPMETLLKEDGHLFFHTWEDDIGKSVFWHSSAHIMGEAILEVFPKAYLAFGPPIDNGFYYDVDLRGVQVTAEAITRIEERFVQLAAENTPFVRKSITKQDALAYYKEHYNPYKLEHIATLTDGNITFYTQHHFTDLCRGPHLPHTGVIKAFKVMNIAGAYWKGDEKNTMLTRFYGISFPDPKELKAYLLFLEAAKKSDHRKIGKELGLFTFSERVGMGLPLWLPKGALLRERLQSFLHNIQLRTGYQPVITPHIGKKELYITSGHYEKYGKDSFQPIETPREQEIFFLKPMNCPHHCEIYKTQHYSYKDLPIRFAEFGTVYRYEQHGELHGLTRVRSFTQDDAHLFCRPDQLEEEFRKVIDIVLYVFQVMDIKEYVAQVSLRDKENPNKYIGEQMYWEKAENAIITVAKETQLPLQIAHGEAAFYGPKLDFMIKDSLGRKWQLGTIQVDYNLPERFDLTYTSASGKKERPVMIHRAPFGSLERFIAVLLEHNMGHFPLWLAPTQAIILSVAEKFKEYAHQVYTQLNNAGIRVNEDTRNETIGKRIREAELAKITYILIVGEKEMATQKVAVRIHKKGNIGIFSISELITHITTASHIPEYVSATSISHTIL